MSQAWYTVNTPVWFFSSVPGQFTLGTPVGFIWSVPGVSPPNQGFPLYWEGKPLTGRGNPWDIRNEPNQCIRSAPGLGNSKQTELVYLQCTRPGTFKMNRTGVFAVHQAWDIR